MRRRLRPPRLRPMARPTGVGGSRVEVSPRARMLAGWLVALLLVMGVAFTVGRLGGEADAPAVDALASASATGSGEPLPILFGTALDAATGEVAEEARTERFGSGDLFGYSVRPAQPPVAGDIYVEVVRVAGGVRETVQEPSPQPIDASPVIAFEVPADELLAAFGTGRYVMRLYLDPQAPPLAEGRFELIGPQPSDRTPRPSPPA